MFGLFGKLQTLVKLEGFEFKYWTRNLYNTFNLLFMGKVTSDNKHFELLLYKETYLTNSGRDGWMAGRTDGTLFLSKLSQSMLILDSIPFGQ